MKMERAMPEIQHLSDACHGYKLIVGDINARVGNVSDLPQIDEHQPIAQLTKDTGVYVDIEGRSPPQDLINNGRGRQMIGLCFEHQ